MIKVGIFFGGPSREREISFAGGRTVYDNLDKSLFEPIPIFVDAYHRLVLLDWELLYKGSIRDFFPPVDFLPPSPNGFQIYQESLPELGPMEDNELLLKIGQEVSWVEVSEMIDFAFLVLHGAYGEDGKVQGLLESNGIPYSGSGVLGSAVGMDKGFQKRIMQSSGWDVPRNFVISRSAWDTTDRSILYNRLRAEVGGKYVIRPCSQGSSIGLSIHSVEEGFGTFVRAVDRGFFRYTLHKKDYPSTTEEKVSLINALSDIKEGLAFPMYIEDTLVNHPEMLLKEIDRRFNMGDDKIELQAEQSDAKVLVEEFINGKEFSCIVVRDDRGELLALPPTEIRKADDLFDYRAKYLPGFVRKITPIEIEESKIEKIRTKCKELFDFFAFDAYARIDGFIQDDGTIYLNDPNTTSGMLPSSFFFHQAAQIGLSPSNILTLIISSSLHERLDHNLSRTDVNATIQRLEDAMIQRKRTEDRRLRVGVIMGGYSFERHISVESGRNIYEKLSSSSKYLPIPLFLVGREDEYQLYHIPVKLLLKDNADDIRDYLSSDQGDNNYASRIEKEFAYIRDKFAESHEVSEPLHIAWTELPSMIDFAFIALHGRPGEDGSIQLKLDALKIPYNGSPAASSAITINKYLTAQKLREHGFLTAEQMVVEQHTYRSDPIGLLQEVEKIIGYPLIAKPVDDGCSSAVMVIHRSDQLETYIDTIFRAEEQLTADQRAKLDLKPSDEFPMKSQVLLESLITANGADRFLEITGGMLSTISGQGEVEFLVFEPSEALATDSILSLEEKFLAGQGQNITPARFSDDQKESERISDIVKEELRKAADLLGVRGYCRIDAFVRVFNDGDVEVAFIEINSLPGLTPATCIFHQTAIEGMKPFDFIDKIIQFGMDETANL